MLSIDKTHIQKLKYEDLENLLGLLCEAELRRYKVSSASVRWGGKQTAKDGGIDVAVNLDKLPYSDGYLKRPNIIIQSKVSELKKSGVEKAMRDKQGNLLDSIKILAENSGSYVLASAQSDFTDPVLQDRIKEMKAIINDDRCHVDFLDGSAIASWVRDFPGMIPWARQKIGEPLNGWKPFGNWTEIPNDANPKFIIDKNLCLRLVGSKKEPFIGLDAVSKLRTSLRIPRESIRLVGLSGVGKTRLVQALFEEEVGTKPLDPATVYYTDSSDSPVPKPKDLLNWLVADDCSGVLLIDNCSDKLHSKLTKLLKASSSNLSLLTIEYDIRKDLPPSTSAFLLEPGDRTTIANVIIGRYSHISQTGALYVATLAGGNYRLALLLAERVVEGEDVSQIEDVVLFERIFYQRKGKDGTLLEAGRILSLVYSFEFSSYAEESELGALSQLSELSPRQLYPLVKELQDRHAVQQRGRWRAVLPHALANRLAQRALGRIPVAELKKVFEQSGHERLLKSFSRRLAYLTTSQEAKEIAESWLKTEGILNDLNDYDRHKMDMLRNVAALCPDLVIDIVSKWVKSVDSKTFGSYRYREGLRKIIGFLAYPEHHFRVCIELLISILGLEARAHETENTRKYIETFFQAILSGTKAKSEERLSFVKGFIASEDDLLGKLGEKSLIAMLITAHFTGNPSYDYERTHIDGGLTFSSEDDVVAWYSPVINYLGDLYDQGGESHLIASNAMHIHLRGLYGLVWLQDVIDKTIDRFLENGSWLSGWVAVTETIKYDREKIGKTYIDRVLKLQKRLEPQSIEDQIEIYVFEVGGQQHVLLEDDEKGELKESIARLRDQVIDLGESKGNDLNWLADHISRLHQSHGLHLWDFGKGFAQPGLPHQKIWSIIKSAFDEKEITLNRSFMSGFMEGLSSTNQVLLENCLDECLQYPGIKQYYPKLQSVAPFGERGVKRLKNSLKEPVIPAIAYRDLWRQRDSLTRSDYIYILDQLCLKEEGIETCLHLLDWQFLRPKGSFEPSEDLRAMMQKILLNVDFNFTYQNRNLDRMRYNEMIVVIENCCEGEKGESTAKLLLIKVLRQLLQHWTVPDNLKRVLRTIAELQPLIFLDACLEPPEDIASAFDNMNHIKPYLFWQVAMLSSRNLKEWVRRSPQTRAVTLATALNAWLPPYSVKEKKEHEVDTKKWEDLFIFLYHATSQKKKVLTGLANFYETSSYSGSKAKFLCRLLPIYQNLTTSQDARLNTWAKNQLSILKKEIALSEEREKLHRLEEDEHEPSFES